MTTRQTNGVSALNRHLIVMRHAKSDWSDESLSDHDRPLNKRGRRDAPRMARWLAEVDLIPDMILSSSSQRTRQTVELMLPQWTTRPVTSFCEALYLSSAETMLEIARSGGGDSRRLMVLAHNPGVSRLVSCLSQKFVEMPTAAIAIFGLSLDDWSQLDAEAPMSLIHSMRPKAL